MITTIISTVIDLLDPVMKLFKQNIYPLLLLVIPLTLTGLLQSSTYFFETMFLAHLGQEVLAAGALVNWLFWTFMVVLVGVLSAINILVAHKYGAEDFKAISFIVRDGLWLAVLLAIPLFFLFWNLAPLLLFLGQNPKVVILAKIYLHALAWGLLPYFVLFSLLEFIVGLGHARVILIFTILSASLTVFFSYALIFGKFGFPALGIAGAGWGTTISYWISVSLLILFIALNEQYRKYCDRIFSPLKKNHLKDLLKTGLPIGLMYSVEVGFFLALTLLSGKLSSELLAANQVVLQYVGTLMSIIFSIAQAITVRMGHLIGAHDILSAERTCYVGISISFVLMLIVALVYWTIPVTLISIDFNVHDPLNNSLVQLTVQLLSIAALFQFFEATRITLFGALRALKDTRFTLLISILSFWGIALPLGYLLASTFHMGGAGFWWAMVTGAAISVILLSWRFHMKIKM